jgi:Mrp family chromosome partitioning ATPase/predicted Fe-Mo cluster-binding NifX family protein
MECNDVEGFSAEARAHALNPRNCGPMDNSDGHAWITGPCGDTMAFWVAARDGKVEKASFITDGCGPSVASGSAAVCLAEGRRVEEAARLSQRDILDALGGLPVESEHCALLAADTLKAACEDYLRRKGEAGVKKSEDGERSCGSCSDEKCSASKQLKGESDADFEERRLLQSRLCRIKHKVIVLSGKGGVGKSTVAVNIAVALMLSGRRVGLLDVDIHGPSVPTMLGLEGTVLQGSEDALLPVDMEGLKVMSIGFLLRSPDDAVIWRGPMKMSVIKQFLRDVAWGDLDFLIVDSPPGTGDEPLSVIQLLGTVDGAVIVTTPQKVAAIDVRKSVSFCRQLGVPVLGVVENMSGFACPHCGEITQILRTGAGKRISKDMEVPLLGSIPMDPKIAESGDSGRAFIHHYAGSPAAAIMREIIRPIEALDGEAPPEQREKSDTVQKEDGHMRIAIPIADGKLSMHFGHCERFALVDVDTQAKKILKREDIDAPKHEPGLLPPWLAERGTRIIIAGGMGQRAQALFTGQGIEVVVGAPAETPERLVADYLAGTLKSGENVCDH